MSDTSRLLVQASIGPLVAVVKWHSQWFAARVLPRSTPMLPAHTSGRVLDPA
jgi:hypothetical protein